MPDPALFPLTVVLFSISVVNLITLLPFLSTKLPEQWGQIGTNENYVLTWQFQVDSGFKYFVRLHFCEFQIEVTEVGDRVFQIYIGGLIAEAQADIIAWSGGNGVPTYKDYAVMIVPKENEKKQNLSIALHPAPRRRTKFSDSILNGIEIFKVDKDGNLAGPNPEPLISSQSRKSESNRATTIAIIGGLVSGFLAISLLLFFWRRFSTSKTKSTKSRGYSLASDLCTHFSLSEIKAATNHFDTALIIGTVAPLLLQSNG